MIHGENASNHGGNVWAGGAPSEWLDYSANIRPGGPPEWVRAALLRAMDNVPYYPQLSMERSRDALGRFLGLPSGAVLPTAGGIAAISLAAGLKVDRVRIPAPAFLEYSQLSESSGRFSPMITGCCGRPRRWEETCGRTPACGCAIPPTPWGRDSLRRRSPSSSP